VFVSIALIDALVPRGLGVTEAERDSILDQVAGFVRAEGALAPLPIRLGLTALSLALLAWLGLGRRDREKALRRWDQLTGAPGRALTRMLRSLSLLAYLDHPLVRSRMGVATVPERQRQFRELRAGRVASGRDRAPSP
jgi:hypothetical protein